MRTFRILSIAVVALAILAAVEGIGNGSASGLTNTFTPAPLNPDFLAHPFGERVADSGSEIGGNFGLTPTPQDFSYTRGMKVPVLAALGSLPVSYDLRTIGRVTSVKDQGTTGACWSFASLGSLESCLLPGESRDFSEDNMVLTSGFDNGGDPYNIGGNDLKAGAYLVRWGGPVNESDDAYGDGYTPAGLGARKHVQEVNWIPVRGSALDNDNIKNAVIQYGAVSTGIYMYNGTPYYRPDTSSYYYNGSSYGNHAVLIVGWNDNYPASNFGITPPGNGAFLIKNSWGTGWGDAGYFYISYYDSVLGADGISAVFNGAQSTDNYSAIYQYDPLGCVSGLGGASTSYWFANVFTAQANSSLSAVGFYTRTPGTSYEVYTGTSLSSKTLCTSGTIDYMGYHTVALPAPFRLSMGQTFVVFVKVTAMGDLYPIPIEYAIAGATSGASAQTGQSYVSTNGTNWSDLTAVFDASANVCLKAYATSPPAPAITSLTPNYGSTVGGTSVLITGINLNEASDVSFGGATATGVTINGAGTQITCTAPAHAAGTVSALVTTPAGTSTDTTSDHFTYLTPATKQLSIGWNLLAGDSGSDTGGLALFGFTGSGYVSVAAANMVAGQGYWCKSSSTPAVTLSTSTSPVSVALGVGWNLIGNSTSGTVGLPVGLTVFTWDGSGYVSSSTLSPGQGAWLKSDTARTVLLQ